MTQVTHFLRNLNIRAHTASLLAAAGLVACAAAELSPTESEDTGSEGGRDIVGEDDVSSDSDLDVTDASTDALGADGSGAPTADVVPGADGSGSPDVVDSDGNTSDTLPSDDTVTDGSGEGDLCGNGTLDSGEECDDGNRESGDGCKSTCTRELNYVCDPCTDDSECGTATDLCVDGACGADCTTIECSPGLVCTGFARGDTTVRQCAPAEGCGLDPAGEDCTNGTDDDGDTRADCEDPDCGGDPACAEEVAGTCERPAMASVGSSTAVPSVDEQSPGCLSIDENEAVFAFTPPTAGRYCMDTRTSVAYDTIVTVRTACDDVSTELGCFDDVTTSGVEFRGYGTVDLASTAQVFVLVDTYSYRTGQSVTLTISEGRCPGSITDPGGDDPDLGEASCVTDVTDVADDFVPGETFRIRCPSGCIDRDFVYGTDIYTDDSWICGAAIHAGAITDAGGQVRVTIAAGQSNYAGSTRNGVTTNDWSSSWSRSFTVAAP